MMFYPTDESLTTIFITHDLSDYFPIKYHYYYCHAIYKHHFFFFFLLMHMIYGFPIISQNRPAKNSVKVTFKHGARRSLNKLRTLLRSNKYRADLTQVKNKFHPSIHFLNIYIYIFSVRTFSRDSSART